VGTIFFCGSTTVLAMKDLTVKLLLTVSIIAIDSVFQTQSL